MRKLVIFLLVFAVGFVTSIEAQDCAGTARGNSDGRFFIMTYDSEADRDAALMNITSITINGSTYNVGPHPTGVNSIRTTPARPFNTFSDPFTGTVTLNPSGEECEYSANVLPITLAYIDAALEKSEVIIRWETSQEINNEGFEIQKSNDGRSFETFLWVDGAGSTNQTQNYEVRDNSYSSGPNYYRFKQMDYDGAFEFSPIVVVNIGSENLLRLQNTVVAQGEDINIINAKSGSYEIYNISGNSVSAGVLVGTNQTVSTAGMENGMYFLKTENGELLKFIVQ